MIFTGVTGGEIVSLLYPLFILNAFCYIIISKESLDGAAYFPVGDGAVPCSAPSVSASAGSGGSLRNGYGGLSAHDRR